MTTAKEIMHTGARYIPSNETLDRAAQLMRELDVGALPVSDPNSPNERLSGIVTDRDIVIKCVAAGHDPSKVTCGDIVEGTPRWIDANADVGAVLSEMKQHRVKRLPVIENKKLVGIISEADLAQHLSDDRLAGFVEAVYAQSA
jgi:CBS domain-containing protein